MKYIFDRFTKKHMIPAATLVEVVISLVIILTVFVVGMMIFVRVTQSSKSDSVNSSRKYMESILSHTVANKKYEHEELVMDSIVYHKEVVEYEGYPDLLLVKIIALQQGLVLDSLKQLIRKEDSENE